MKPRRIIMSLFVLLVIAFIIPQSKVFSQTNEHALGEAQGSVSYQFTVNENGYTKADVFYKSAAENGSSWILVPKFEQWINHTQNGDITDWALCDTQNVTGNQLYFYQALCFSFNTKTGDTFGLHISFNFATGAMIIEPNGIFYSPQIGFKEGSNFDVSVAFPFGFEINDQEALAVGTKLYSPTYTNSNYVRFESFPSAENMMRIQIGFQTPIEKPELLEIGDGIFTFETVSRYEQYACGILNLYDQTYNSLVRLFNVTLEGISNENTEGVNMRFFLPEFSSLLSVGGYVPFFGEKIGDIHINIVYTRFVKGYIEVIALHELVHHFLWKTGISPENLLWFHEGLAQYVSIKTADSLGYEGGKMMKQELDDGVRQLITKLGGSPDLRFLKSWSPSNQPTDYGTLYVASYFIVERLAEPRNELEFYAKFFEEKAKSEIDDNAQLAYYMSLSAEESFAKILNAWNLDIPDLYADSTMIYEIAQRIGKLNPLFQPYGLLAQFLYDQALSKADNSASEMRKYLSAANTIAISAPLLSIITWASVIFGFLVLVLKSGGVFHKSQDSNFVCNSP